MIENLISNEFILFSLLIFLISLLIDLIIGELPNKIHPVVFIGNIINFLLNYLIKIKNKFSGVLLTILTTIVLLTIFLIILNISNINFILFVFISSLILSSTYSIKMLLSSAKEIEIDLNNDLDVARKKTSYLVSRNTKDLNQELITSATIESLSENVTDSYIAPVFYYFLFIIIFSIFNINNIILLILIPLLYRVINTLDAMVGYKDKKYINIGFFPAKIDDILNYIPSRIGGFLIVISAFLLRYDYKNSYKIFKRDSTNCPSPNSGFTMAPTAGALDIQLIKKDIYILGDNIKVIKPNDISKTIKLSKIAIILFSLIFLIIIKIIYLVML
ncbi:cobalamin biosynthesis protein [Methanobrevibacter sp. OttesenSCG-928-I08]|nr:cobalamin biosynthesis protein [Methanobrevibacter sp. OttesenSCG-928-I08]